MSAGTSDFVSWSWPSPLLDAIGGLQQHPHDPLRMGFTVEGAKTNSRGFLHAGVIATIGDVAIGHTLSASTDPPTRLVTINLSCDLLGTARLGDWVDVIVTPTRIGRRLAAGSASFRTTRAIAEVTALFMPALESGGDAEADS